MSSQQILEGPVFTDPEVASRVLSYTRKEGMFSENEIWQWLRKPPQNTIVRVNTLKTNAPEEIKVITDHIRQNGNSNSVYIHDDLEEVVVVHGTGHREIVPETKVVVVGEMCGLAVLRGADVFSPGILSAPVDLLPGDRVSVVADVTNRCLKGAKVFEGKTCFVGNGLSKVSRDDLFKTENVKGIGIEILERVYDCPSIDESLFSGKIMLQNFPSIKTVDVLNPQPGETVLDMCAAPGGKTTHIAQRMNNKGSVIAYDKSTKKVEVIRKNCERMGAVIVKAFVMDGTKSYSENSDRETESPPFPAEYFDRILIDAPCSGLGQRPQFFNKMNLKELDSFPKIQRKLFATAVNLLKDGGTLVYSTCTNNPNENEEIVKWAIETFPYLKSIPLEEHTEHGCLKFGKPRADVDTISFFISKFQKISEASDRPVMRNP